jgi:hypothetical protein
MHDSEEELSVRPNNWLRRVSLVLLVAAYYAVYQATYLHWVHPQQEAWGYGLVNVSVSLISLNWILVLIPALWCPIRLTRISQVFFYGQYLLLFVPLTVVAHNSSLTRLSPDDVQGLINTCFVSLSIWQLIYLKPFRQFTLPSSGYFSPKHAYALYLLTFLFFLAQIAVFGQNFQLTNFEEVYSLRATAGEIASKFPFALYGQIWLTNVLLPLCVAVALLMRHRSMFLLMFLALIALYGLGGQKTVLFVVVLIPPLIFWAKRCQSTAPHWLVGLLIFILSAPIVFTLFPTDSGEFLGGWYVALVHSRLFSIPALLTTQYADFFAANPLTYWSHVSGFRAFMHYPYELDIPRTLGIEYYNTPVGSNVGFWAQDGIAAIGLPGILVMSMFVAILMYGLDRAASRHDLQFSIVSIAVIAPMFLNVSVFTLLLTGGLFFLMLALFVFPPLRKNEGWAG